MARMATRPKTVLVWYRGIPYRLDLVRCRRALVERQIAGELDSMEALADKVGISRSTASRFFSGRPISLAVTLNILKALKLTFNDVAHPDDPEDLVGAVVTGSPRPDGGQDGVMERLSA